MCVGKCGACCCGSLLSRGRHEVFFSSTPTATGLSSGDTAAHATHYHTVLPHPPKKNELSAASSLLVLAAAAAAAAGCCCSSFLSLQQDLSPVLRRAGEGLGGGLSSERRTCPPRAASSAELVAHLVVATGCSLFEESLPNHIETRGCC